MKVDIPSASLVLETSKIAIDSFKSVIMQAMMQKLLLLLDSPFFLFFFSHRPFNYRKLSTKMEMYETKRKSETDETDESDGKTYYIYRNNCLMESPRL